MTSIGKTPSSPALLGPVAANGSTGKRARSDRSCLLRGWRLPLPNGRRGGEPKSRDPSPLPPAQKRSRCPARWFRGAGRAAALPAGAAAGPGRRDTADGAGAPPPPPRTHRPFPTLIIVYFSDEALLVLPVLPFWSRA